MVPVQRFMSDALVTLLRQAPLTPEKVAFAWRAAVGPALDKVTSVDLQGGVLRVRAKDAAWHREIERSLPLIRVRLDTMLGTGTVSRVDLGLLERGPESGVGSRR